MSIRSWYARVAGKDQDNWIELARIAVSQVSDKLDPVRPASSIADELGIG